MTQKIQRVIHFFDKVTIVTNYISALAAISLIFIVCLSVSARYFFNSPFPWSEEICAYIFLYHCFLALAYTTYREAHVAAEILYVRFSPKAKYLITIAGYILGLVVSVVVISYGLETTYDYFVKDWASDTTLAVTLWPIILVVPAGFFVFALQCFSRIYVCHRRMVATGSPEEEKSLFGFEKSKT